MAYRPVNHMLIRNRAISVFMLWVLLGVPSVRAAERERDDPRGRLEATLKWFGGEPTLEYLQQQKAVAQEELRRWSWSFPNSGAVSPLFIPGSDRVWVNLGPRGGRSSYVPEVSRDVDEDSARLALQGIVTHPTNPQIIYVATASGGVWKATNADLNSPNPWNWAPSTDSLPYPTAFGSLSVGALAIDPVNPDILYLGLGDAFFDIGY